jgi:hypothetical protein
LVEENVDVLSAVLHDPGSAGVARFGKTGGEIIQRS